MSFLGNRVNNMAHEQLLESNGFSSEVEQVEIRNEQLKNLIKEIRKSKQLIFAENKLLEKCLNDTIDLSPLQTAKPSISSLRDIDYHADEKLRRRSIRTSTTTSLTGTSLDAHKTLSFEQKCKMAELSTRILRKEIETMRKQKEKEIDQLNVQIDEIDARRDDIQNENEIFCKLIVEEGAHSITGLIRTEKVYQYLNRILKKKDLQIERCRLAIDTSKKRYKYLKKKIDEDDFIPMNTLEYELLQTENSELQKRFQNTELELIKAKKEFDNVLIKLEKKKFNLKRQIKQNEIAKKNIQRSQKNLIMLNGGLKKELTSAL